MEEASSKANDLVKLYARGGFKLTKVVSEVNQLKPELTSNREKAIPSADENSHALGPKWNH